MNNVKVIF